MKKRKIRENVYWMGALDWDRRLFDDLIPLPDGTSYNAYLIQGSEKTVLIDSVDPTKSAELVEQLKEVDKLDYVVSHHAEQDHSGAIPQVLEVFPKAKVIVSPKGKGMLIDLLGIAEDAFIIVEDGETLSLGDKTLRFIHTPWVHWPETMVTYLEEERILFSCDFFGSHIATSELYVTDQSRVYEAAKRYFSEIMMPFRNEITKNTNKLKAYDIQMIAPSHGQVYHEPAWIMEAYHDWVEGDPQNLVVLPFVSMHGSTRILVERLTSALIDRGVHVELFNLSVTDIGKLAIALVDAATIVVGAPTVLTGPHPLSAYATMLANALMPKAKFISIIGSYGWGGKTVETLAALIPRLKVEVLTPILCKGVPSAAELEAVDNLASTIAQKHKECGFK